MNKVDENLLKVIGSNEYKGAYNIRKNGETIERQVTDNINIVSKEDNKGLDIYIKSDTKNEVIDIPVILTDKGLKDTIYNDFYIGDNVDIIIVAGCGIHNEYEADSEHDGIHRFIVGENSKVKYIEKHYGEGIGKGKKILSPVTEIHLKNGSTLEMDTSQIKGVNKAKRTTKATLEDNATLTIVERLMTDEKDYAKTIFDVKLNGKNSKVKVTSRSVCTGNSKQDFVSLIEGNNECFGHVECDAILKDNGKCTSTPTIKANNINAELIHEATIGKIASDELKKLMTLGLPQELAERTIIKGFLK